MCLQEFIAQWQNHPLSSENNMTPLPLFTDGTLLNINSDYSGIEGILSESDLLNYGIDTDTLLVEDEDYQINVPEVVTDLTAEQRIYLEANCNSLIGNGQDRYIECVQVLYPS